MKPGRPSAPRRLDLAALLFCGAVLGAAVLYPTLRMAVEAATRWVGAAVTEPRGLAAIRNTLVMSLASVATAGLLGTGLAVVLTRRRFPGSRALAVLAYLPFTLPPLVGVLGFYYLIGRDGVVPRLLERWPGLADGAPPGWLAILFIHTYSFYVFFYAMAGPALAGLDRAQVEAARTLGAGPWRAFLRVTLPQLRPALLGASLLTFMSSGASFSAPYFFGRDFPMLSVRVYEETSQFNLDEALTLTVVLAGVSLAGVLLFRGRRQGAGRASKGTPAPLRHGGARLAAGAAAWGFIALLLTPHLVLVWLSFADYRAWHTEILPTVFTLDNYARLLRDPGAFAPIRNSLWMSALATGATGAVALPAAWLIARRRPGGRWVNVLVMIPWALPGTVIAMNLIVSFNEHWLPLYNTVWMLPLAYFVRNIPLLTRMAGAAIEPFDASLVEAGLTLGASRGYCFRRVVAPLIAPAVVAGMALVFATSLGEFVASILLYTPSNIPIAVKINMEWRTALGPAFAYSVVLMVLVGATFALSRRFASRVM